jgi:hypothetical protein
VTKPISVTALVLSILALGSLPIAAQWPTVSDPNVPRDSNGKVRGDRRLHGPLTGNQTFPGFGCTPTAD